ncbi:hypothetical protein EVAR_43264_1 [Eumeta japonica]|uniref:Uncharacterized protein n=1 Tax=Eumeta variegata TaxID=151549 RepID=A0A4C1WVH3_EUMVA|nr:hypothetical protein EVAR_43264_1 [Eumeta japonica]
MYTVVNSTIKPSEKGVSQSLAHGDTSPHRTHYYLRTVYYYIYGMAWRSVATPESVAALSPRPLPLPGRVVSVMYHPVTQYLVSPGAVAAANDGDVRRLTSARDARAIRTLFT